MKRTFPGFSVGKKEKKLGIRSSPTTEIIFEDCRVPVENVLGEVGEGFKIAMMTLDGGRNGIAAQAVGIAQGALDAAVDYAKERVQFGKPIACNKELALSLRIWQQILKQQDLLTYQAAWLEVRRTSIWKRICNVKAICWRYSDESNNGSSSGIWWLWIYKRLSSRTIYA